MSAWTSFRSSLRLRRVSLAWYSIGLIAYGWMIIAFFPLIDANPEYLEAVENLFSEELMAAFGGAGLQFTTLGGFLSIEYLSLIWVFIVGAAVITFAAGALGGAVEDGTMEMTLSQPISRLSVSLTRYLAMAAYAVVLSFVTSAGLYLAGLLHDVAFGLDAAALLFVAAALVSLAIGGFAFLISAMTTGRGRTLGATLGVLVAMYLADVLGNLNEDYSWLSDVSLFNYWRPNEIIDDLVIAGETWLVFGITAVVTLLGALVAFQRRDVA